MTRKKTSAQNKRHGRDQLFAHLGFLGEAHLGRGLGYIDDDELIAIMHRHRVELLARCQGRLPSCNPPGRRRRFLEALYRGSR